MKTKNFLIGLGLILASSHILAETNEIPRPRGRVAGEHDEFQTGGFDNSRTNYVPDPTLRAEGFPKPQASEKPATPETTVATDGPVAPRHLGAGIYGEHDDMSASSNVRGVPNLCGLIIIEDYRGNMVTGSDYINGRKQPSHGGTEIPELP